jgi:hypothetical protein
MGASKRDDVRGAALAAVKGEVFVHDSERDRPPCLKLVGDADGVPEGAQESAHEGIRPGKREVHLSRVDRGFLLDLNCHVYPPFASPAGFHVGASYHT